MGGGSDGDGDAHGGDVFCVGVELIVVMTVGGLLTLACVMCMLYVLYVLGVSCVSLYGRVWIMLGALCE